LKNLGPTQKSLRPTWRPNLVTSLHTYHFIRLLVSYLA